MIVIKFGFDYGNNFSCLWSGNQEAVEKFEGYTIEHKELNISEELDNRMTALCQEYQSSLNWDYPPDPSPWTKEQKLLFSNNANQAYNDLCAQVGDNYQIIYDVLIPE